MTNDEMIKFADFLNSFQVEYTSNADIDSIYIYHYTSIEGLKGILDKEQLRFTDRFCLNDYSEGIYVLNLCINKINEITKDIFTDEMKKEFMKCCQERLKRPATYNFYVYQCSFSMSSDSLCMWNYYTKGNDIQGYNLKFNSAELRNNLILKPTPEINSVPNILSGKVVYEEKKQIDIIRKILMKFVNFFHNNVIRPDHNLTSHMKYVIDKIMIQGIFFKPHYFDIENEYRLAINLLINDDGQYAAISNKREFMTKKDMIVPFTYIKFNPSVLRGLTLSPTLDYESTRVNIFNAFQKKFANISIDNIVKSKIPVRF